MKLRIRSTAEILLRYLAPVVAAIAAVTLMAGTARATEIFQWNISAETGPLLYQDFNLLYGGQIQFDTLGLFDPITPITASLTSLGQSCPSCTLSLVLGSTDVSVIINGFDVGGQPWSDTGWFGLGPSPIDGAGYWQLEGGAGCDPFTLPCFDSTVQITDLGSTPEPSSALLLSLGLITLGLATQRRATAE